MTKEQLKDYLVEEAGYDREEVELMYGYNMLSSYLAYNGIIGYTDDIIDVVKAVGIENL